MASSNKANSSSTQAPVKGDAVKAPTVKATLKKSTKAKFVSSSEIKFTKAEIKQSIVRHLHSTLGTDENKANNHAWWKATSAAMQELVLERLRSTQKSHYINDTRAVHYFSAEFLM